MLPQESKSKKARKYKKLPLLTIITFVLDKSIYLSIYPSIYPSFLVNPEVVPGRMTMLVTLFLVLINIHNTIQTNSPKVGG